MNVILLMLITALKVLLTVPVTKRCGRCRLTISCSDETKKGGEGGGKWLIFLQYIATSFKQRLPPEFHGNNILNIIIFPLTLSLAAWHFGLGADLPR